MRSFLIAALALSLTACGSPALAAAAETNAAALDAWNDAVASRDGSIAAASGQEPAWDKFTDLWDVNYRTKDGVCHGVARNTPETGGIIVDLVAENGGVAFTVGPDYANIKSEDGAAMMGTLKFSNGVTIRNGLTTVTQAGITVIVMDGLNFLDQAGASDSVDFSNAQGDTFSVKLNGRVDLLQGFKDCVMETPQFKAAARRAKH